MLPYMTSRANLRDRRVRTVGVLDASGKLVGVISQADIFRSRGLRKISVPRGMRVSEVMTTDLVTVSPENANRRMSGSDGTTPHISSGGWLKAKIISGNDFRERFAAGNFVGSKSASGF